MKTQWVSLDSLEPLLANPELEWLAHVSHVLWLWMVLVGCGSAELVDAVFHREAKAESKEAEAIKHPGRSWNETSN